MTEQQDRPLVEIIEEHLAKGETKLPPLDATALHVQREMAKPEPSIKVIEKLIARDQALTGQVLKMANSAFYRGLQKVSTVRAAIVRLGADEVANIVMLVSQRKNFFTKDPALWKIVTGLWRHSVSVGIGARWLAKERGYRDMTHEAFFAGLLHDVGKLFILTVIEEIKQAGKIRLPSSNSLLIEVMQGLHTVQGYDLMKNWNLPQKYCEVARDHHADEFDAKNHLLVMIRLANMACNKMGIGLDKAEETMLSVTL
ncbi:MAG: HDOD domain-containing protein, partial [Desulfobacterales bacterium]|nr:HDOD domain-containing protein [Desulfobacterales bacterium]